MSEYFVGTTGANNQTTFESLTTSEVLDDLQLNTTDSPTFANVTATAFFGDGSNLTGLSSSTDNTKLPLAGGTLTGDLNLTYAYPRINLTDTNHNSDYSIINNDGAFSVYDITNNSHRLSISAGGNVGIGTTSPVEKLHIPSGNGVMLGFKRFFSGTGVVPAGTGSSSTLTATLNNQHGTTLTSQFQYKFYLTTTSTGTYNSSVYIVYRNGGDTAWVAHRVSSTGLSSNHPELTVSGNNALIFNDHANAYTVYYRVETTFSGQAKTSPQLFGSDYMWTRDNTELYYMGGSVGIGTTSPASTLEIEAPSSANGTELKITSAFGESPKILSFDYLAANTNTSVAQIIGFGRPSTSGGPYMQFKVHTGSTLSEAMRITSSGKVGIGTDSPSYPLHVLFSGDTGARIESTDNHSSLFIDSHSSKGQYIRFTENNSDKYWIQSFGGKLNFRPAGTGTAANYVSFDATGNVGIGTISPRGKLDIVGNTDDDADFLTIQDNDPSAGSHRPSIRFRSDTAQIGQIASLDNGMRFSVGTTEDSLLEIKSGGNVGIGTTSPDHKLHVKGDVTIDNESSSEPSMLHFNATNKSNHDPTARINFWEGDSHTGTYTGSHAYIEYNGSGAGGGDGYLAIGGNTDSGANSDIMVINRLGRVGIGVASPAYKLDVAGDVKTSTRYLAKTGTSGQDLVMGFWDAANARIESGAALPMLITSYEGNIKLGISGGTTMTVKSTAVGIGTTSPAARLELKGSTADTTANAFIARDSASASLFSIRNDGRVDAPGDVVIGGNLTVSGTTTTINTTNLRVEDHNIELGNVNSPTDITADGGGITLLAGSNEADHKTIKWINSTDAWTFSERVSIPAGSAASPSLTFAGDTDTGIYRSAADRIGFSAGGSQRAYIDANGISSTQNVYAGGEFRNYSNVWKATTGVTGNGFQFINSVDGTALTISSTGDTVASGSVTATGLDINGAADISGNLEVGEYILRSGQGSNYHRFLASRQIFVVGNASSIDLNNGTSTFGATGGATTLQGSSLLLDSAADITLDAGGQDIILSDDGTIFGTLSNSSGLQIRSRVSNADMYLRGVDGGTEFTALRLDMSAGGVATFSSNVIVNGGQILTPSGTNLALNPNTGIVSVGGVIQCSGTGVSTFAGNISLPDANPSNNVGTLKLGTGGDLQIYHDGSNSYITEGGTGGLVVKTGDFYLRNTSNADMIYATSAGAVNLYHDGSTRLSTTATGVDVTGTINFAGGASTANLSFGDNDQIQMGTGNDLRIYHNGSHSYIRDQGTGNLIITGSQLTFSNVNDTEYMAKMVQDGTVELYYDGSKKFETTSTGVDITGHLSATTKSFLVDNPETGGKLQYGVVESDQHSVLVRGKNDTETIELPEEWEWLVDGDSVTVDLTSIGQIQQLFVVSQDNKTIKIGGLATNGKYNYTVYGERKDVEKLEVNI